MSDNKQPTLAHLRQELDKHDAELLKAVRKRLDIVEEIFEAKKREGSSLFDRSREKVVYEKARRTADEIGLDQQIASDITSVIIDAAHMLQEQRAQSVGSSDQKVNILIVGGKGKMGVKFVDAFSNRGHNVSVLDKGDKLDADLVGKADVVIVAVSMSAAEEVAKQVAPLVRKDALLCDINSLKSEICSVMKANCKGEVLGTHPVFGPSVKSFRKQKMVLCPIKSGPRSEWFRHELGQLGLEMVDSDPERHDRAMAIVQVLTHFNTIVMGETLRSSGTSIEETLCFMSPIYKLELSLIGRLFAQNPHLYSDIVMNNKDGKVIREKFLDAANRIHKISSDGDRKSFENTFKEIHDYFKDFSEEAFELSDLIINTVVSRP